MTVLSYRGSRADTQHENQAFDTLLEGISNIWKNSEERVVIIGNFLCNGRQIDAAIFTKQSIIIIDFKDYGGGVELSENGPWYKDDTIVKAGGSRNPYLQLRANKYSGLAPFLEMLGPMPSGGKCFFARVDEQNPPDGICNLHHINTMVVFLQPISFDSSKLKLFPLWFNVTQLNDVPRLLNQITSPQINLQDRDIDFIVDKLGVEQYIPISKQHSTPGATSGPDISSQTAEPPPQKKPDTNNHKRTTEPKKEPSERWAPNGSTTRIFIGATHGFAELLLLETPHGIGRSLIRLNNTTREAFISIDNDYNYNDFVSPDTGYIASRFGKGPYRAHISINIEDGRSWELGMFAAHCLYSKGKLASEEDKAGAAVWVTGVISTARGLPVEPVEHIPRKIQQSEQLFADILRQGIELTIVVPEANASELPYIEAQLSGIARTGPTTGPTPRIVTAKNCAQMCQEALDIKIEPDPVSQGKSEPQSPRGQDGPKSHSPFRSVAGLAVAGLAAVVLFSVIKTSSPPQPPPTPETISLQPEKSAEPGLSPAPVPDGRQRIGQKVDLGVQWDEFD